MGYVKLDKAGTEYDLLPAENIGSIKLGVSSDVEIIVKYIPSGTSTIVPTASTDFVQADVDKITDAVNKINGASGPGIFPDALSQLVLSVTVS
jgi:hypothetical protein